MRKSSDNFACLYLCRRRALLRLFDDLRKIFGFSVSSVNMPASRIAGRTCRIKPVLVAVLRRNNAVRCHKDRSVKAFKLFFLLPPGIAVVSGKIRVLLKRRIIMGRKHLAVCINVYSCSLRLFQKKLQVAQIMSGNQDARIFPYADIDFCDLRIAICLRICFIKKSHAIHAVLSCFQRQRDKIVHGQ